MHWQYRTILFEFHKDGLLGDKYIDDEEMEKVLNEHGERGWELVSVTTVQEGLLSFFKRVQLQPRKKSPASPAGSGAAVKKTPRPPVIRAAGGQNDAPAAAEEQEDRTAAPASSARDAVDDIKIR